PPEGKTGLKPTPSEITRSLALGAMGQLIYTAGGYYRQSLSYLEAYNPRDGSWIRLADLQVPRSGLGGCVVGGLFYAVGGRNNSPDGNTDSAAIDCYNPMTDQWSPCAPMSVPRNRIGVGVIDGMIYAVGGSHGSLICPGGAGLPGGGPRSAPREPKSAPGADNTNPGLADNKHIIYPWEGADNTNPAPQGVLRGLIGTCVPPWVPGTPPPCSAQTLLCVMCVCVSPRYEPERDEWQLVAPMLTRRIGVGVAVLNRLLYAVGGFDGSARLSSAEWGQLASPNPYRHRAVHHAVGTRLHK
uniref:Kelch like ECH associated protein 1 n=1 Tax=Buteo japonicus TaxID=224669 RepID=A0A8C0HSA8_9AVES